MSHSAVQNLANMAGSPSALQELQSLLFRARALHAHLADQVQQSIGLDSGDIKARYGHFPRTTDETVSAKRRNKHKHPEPMGAPLTSVEKRKMRLLLHSLRADNDDGDDGATHNGATTTAAAAAAGGGLSLADLRGLSRSSVALFERFVLRSADVADSDADSEHDFSDTVTTTSDGGSTSAGSSRVTSPRRQGEDDQRGDDDANNNNNNNNDGDDDDDGEQQTRSAACQTQESSMQAAHLAQRILSGDSDESFGGLKSRRFPHRVPKPPVARGAYQPKSKDASTRISNSSNTAGLSDPVAGQSYTAIAFRPQSLKQLQMNSPDAAEGAENSAGWTPTFFPVEITFTPGLSSSSSGGGGGDSAGGGGGGDRDKSTTGGGSSSSAVAGSKATSAADTDGSARLVVRRVPITRDGQRYATSRNDAQQTVVADVGCGALRSLVVGQTTRFFLRGRMVLQKKPEWAKKWEWRVPPSLAVHQQQQQPSSPPSLATTANAGGNRIPPVVDFTALPTMAQMADRCMSLAFVDATVLNLPAKTPDVEEDAALQAAATKASSSSSSSSSSNTKKSEGSGADDEGPTPLHVTATAPPNFLASAGAELALAFPSHAEFNSFLAEAMHWCGDFAAFRYGRPADFHSADVLRSLPPQVRDQWQTQLDEEEVTFCEEFHVPPSVYLTARRRVTASADPTKSMTSDNGLLCEEDLATICDVDYLQLSAMVRFLQARGLVKLHSLYHVRKPM